MTEAAWFQWRGGLAPAMVIVLARARDVLILRLKGLTRGRRMR